MAEIMGQRHCLCQILVQVERTRNGACNLRHFEGMGEAGTIVVAFVVHKDLGLVLQLAEGASVDDPVPIALERRASRARRLLDQAASATIRMTCKRGKRLGGHDGADTTSSEL